MNRVLSIGRDGELAARKSSNFKGIRSDTAKGQKRTLDARIALVANDIWESNRAKLLAQTAKCSVSTAKRYLAGGGLSFRHFLNLLSSEYGDRFLDVFLADAPPTWWRRRKQIQQLAKLKRDQLRALKELEQLEITFAADD